MVQSYDGFWLSPTFFVFFFKVIRDTNTDSRQKAGKGSKSVAIALSLSVI